MGSKAIPPYLYDAVGNRLRQIADGTTTVYMKSPVATLTKFRGITPLDSVEYVDILKKSITKSVYITDVKPTYICIRHIEQLKNLSAIFEDQEVGRVLTGSIFTVWILFFLNSYYP